MSPARREHDYPRAVQGGGKRPLSGAPVAGGANGGSWSGGWYTPLVWLLSALLALNKSLGI